MAGEVRSAFAALVDDPPKDLVAHFSRNDLPQAPDLGIKVLPLEKSLEYTRAIHHHVVVGKLLGLVVLDDSNNSNPFCYITKGLLRGCILHLSHDDDTCVAFRSLETFMNAMSEAVLRQQGIDEIRDDRPFLLDDQEGLATRLEGLLAGDNDNDSEALILIPLLDTSRLKLMRSLVISPDFYVREAAAQQIAAWPNVDLLAAAEALIDDDYPQVARPARQAVAAIRRLMHGTP
ncbi:MAG: hypothetical protein WBC44_02080 [Planctomycetaceae bacterium]